MIPDDSSPLPSGGNLLRNALLFGRLLRSLGMEVTPTQVVDVVDSLSHIHIGNRTDFKNGLRALLVNRREQIPLFDEAFDLFWIARRQNELNSLDLSQLTRKRKQPKPQIEKIKSVEEHKEGQNLEEREEPYIDKIQTYSDIELLRQKDFGSLDDDEAQTVRKLMSSILWHIEPRRTRRTEITSRGRLIDLRRTIRRNVRYGGEILELTVRERKVKRRPVVLLCDISGSMERYSRILLQFIYVVSSRLDRVESFVFSTRLTRITRSLRYRDVNQALAEASRSVTDWAGGTRIGEAIKQFNYQWARRVLNQGAIVLIISDGWDRGDVEVLAHEMERLHRSCHRLIWLNPLLGDADYQPLVRGIQAALPHVDDFLPVHNLASLEQLAKLLARDV
ncbi:MAG: VWA domain-containing protein [Caldilineaceae bacterium]